MALASPLTHASFRTPLPSFKKNPSPKPYILSNPVVDSKRRLLGSLPHFFNPTTFWVISSRCQHVRSSNVSPSANTPLNGGDGLGNEILEDWEFEKSSLGISFLAKLAIALGIAVAATIISICFKRPTLGSSFGVPFLFDGSSASAPAVPSVGFTLTIFGYRVVLPQYAPGWIYFWLLMAAGCGLFISEEALNIWVGTSLARMLSLDGSWTSFAESFSKNAPYIISTVLWVYWGVCISDMIPFYLGKLFRRSKASKDVCSKVGISKEKAASVTRVVQKYGNLIGFVERFSLGVRNPTAFLAGALGISSEYFFAGVCCGGLLTLPIQLGIGFLLRERPVVAIASVATAVGIWTVFPYLFAASTALFLFLRQRYST
ncbi:uncharacterized protein LOC143862501 isoform X2 [Tasmannia lanceolata]|uniref:uncharacterized protein LOC143862501 isoform X2 n=1 Tax=Tasmannia lanceolata TaxID=3420 RepID=UPI004063D03A